MSIQEMMDKAVNSLKAEMKDELDTVKAAMESDTGRHRNQVDLTIAPSSQLMHTSCIFHSKEARIKRTIWRRRRRPLPRIATGSSLASSIFRLTLLLRTLKREERRGRTPSELGRPRTEDHL
jgi:hypothetical protein